MLYTKCVCSKVSMLKCYPSVWYIWKRVFGKGLEFSEVMRTGPCDGSKALEGINTVKCALVFSSVWENKARNHSPPNSNLLVSPSQAFSFQNFEKYVICLVILCYDNLKRKILRDFTIYKRGKYSLKKLKPELKRSFHAILPQYYLLQDSVLHYT